MATPYTPGRPLTRLGPPPVPRWRGQQVVGYRYAKYRASTDQYLGALRPDEGGVLALDATQAVARSLRLTLSGRDAEEWDPVDHRLRVWMLTADGTAWQLGGRYMSVDDTEVTDSSGTVKPLALADETWQTSHEIGTSFSAYSIAGDGSRAALGQNVARVAHRFLRRYRLFNPTAGEGPALSPTPDRPWRMPVLIDATQYLTSAAWQGSATGTAVMDALAVAGDYLSPWVDNTGTYRMIRQFDPADPGRVPDFDFDENGWDLPAPPVTTDLLDAPNRYIVVANSGTGTAAAPVVGTYDVPSTAPWSIARRGYVVATTQTMPVESAPQAAAMARGLAQRQQVYKRAVVATPPDPRHDAHQVVRWRGETWLQTGWSLPLDPGTSMTHSLRRAYV